VNQPRWRSLPPSLLEPILVVAQRVDARLRGIRPMRAGGLMGIEWQRWGGAPMVLDDGTRVVHGDRVGEFHFLNRRAAAVSTPGYQTAAFRMGHDDLRALAAWSAAQPPALRPVAYHGVTIHAAFPRREGWQVRARRRTLRARLDEWYMRWLMGHFAREGRRRLRRGHGALESVEFWLSADDLERRYGLPTSSRGTSRPSGRRTSRASGRPSTAPVSGRRPGSTPRAKGRSSAPRQL
jgi:YkoP domain